MAESIQQYETAAGERLFDGLAIAVTPGRESSAGSVYLWGYVIEMVLKAAFFRAAGTPPTVPANLAAVARALGKQSLSAGEKHDLNVLLRAVVAARTTAGKPLNAALGADLTRRVARAAGAWTVDQRYDPVALSESVVNQMYEDAAWVFTQRLVIG